MGPMICFAEDGSPFMQLGQFKLHLDIAELHGEFLERAQKELRETPERRTEAIASLRKLLSNESDLIIPADENEFLLKFLRPCKFYPESAYKLMKRYYRFKLKNPKLSIDLVPSALKPMISEGVVNFLPNRDKTGCRIMIVYMENWNTKNLKLNDMFRAIMMFIEIAMAEPKTQVAGVQVIFDMNGLTMSHVYQFGPSFARTLLEWVQECVPLRLKGVHMVNEPKIFNILFSIFKPFMNEKLRKRIKFHGTNFNELLEIFGPDSLPITFGGNMDIPKYPGTILAEFLCHYEEEFQKANSIGYSKEKVITNKN